MFFAKLICKILQNQVVNKENNKKYQI